MELERLREYLNRVLEVVMENQPELLGKLK
jgi:hypothetical protein